MEPPDPVLFRRKTLTNTAAEFVERNVGIEAVFQLEDHPGELETLLHASEFCPEIDRFAPKGLTFDLTKYYESSIKNKEKLGGMLKRFATILKERKVDSQLNITIKDPNDPCEFTFDYVLGIINKIGEARGNAAKTRSCKNFIRKYYRKLEDNQEAIQGLLTMIPNDIYGSVLSGGFTLILAAVEKHHEQRETIQNFLAEIPEKLETIQRLSRIHYRSVRLHSCADSVMVAVFTVLERIVEKITRTWKIKLAEKTNKMGGFFPLRIRNKLVYSRQTGNEDVVKLVEDDDSGQEHELTVADALEGLQCQIEHFQTEAELCEQERLGRIEVSTTDLKRGLVLVAKQNKDTMESVLNKYEEIFLGTEDNLNKFFLQLHDSLYRFCTSNPNFDAKTGEVDLKEAKLSQRENRVRSKRFRQESNARIASKWLKGTRGFAFDPMADIKDCLDRVELLERDDKSISQSILSSERLSDWLQGENSSIFDISLQTPPASLDNPLSFISAILTTTFLSAAKSPVLAFFCRHRNNESPSEADSGPVALVNSLNGQLIEFIAKHRSSVNLLTLVGEKSFPKTQKSLEDGLCMLYKLLCALPEEDVVFVIIDSLSCLSGRQKDGDRVIKTLRQVIKSRPDIVIKVMVTDAFADSKVKKLADISLFVQDSVAGFGAIDIVESSDDISKKMTRTQERKGKGTQAVSEDEDEASESGEATEGDSEADEDDLLR
ncbi:hypothetical protein F5Y05DRAFT_379832 [Hypoxylon sp. FL0543]|nr:hypothetical protein F5Y05DRAFT_379832 [Hypoxylon sp. FL0543]